MRFLSLTRVSGLRIMSSPVVAAILRLRFGLTLTLVSGLLFVSAQRVVADELLPPGQPIEQVIDSYIDATLKKQNIAPAPQVDDANLIRRVTLDLVGRIPTPLEIKTFVESKEPDKRNKLVDRLINSPGFVRYQAVQFDAMMTSQNNRSASMRDYFVTALSENRSWSTIFRELMLPDVKDTKQKGSIEFLKARVTDADRLTNDVSVTFFGVNISCAQCHNHPLVEAWKQDHFYGMKSFLIRTFDNGGMPAERGFGLVKFKPAKGPERQAQMMFLTGKVIENNTLRDPNADEKKKEQERLDKAKAAKIMAPAPDFSARAKLVETALQAGQSDFFARSIVNRLWHRMMGYGLVMPLDQMHSENPPSHPELMSWLARDMAANNYDMRRLIRGIVLSKTYSRGSKYDGKTIPEAKWFAVARLKAMTPSQLATSMKIAMSDPKEFETPKADELEKKLEGLESFGRGFAGMLAQPSDDFQIGVSEALLFSNSPRITQEFLSDNGLLGQVKQMKDSKQAVEFLVRSILGRQPAADELKWFTDYLASRSDRQPEAYRQIAWALITSAEFRFNY
jgi:hypothetical protein